MLKNGKWVECKDCKYFDRMNNLVGHCTKRDVVLDESDGCMSWEQMPGDEIEDLAAIIPPKKGKSGIDQKNKDHKYAERQKADTIRRFAKVKI